MNIPTRTIGFVNASENSGLFKLTTAEKAEMIASAAKAAAPIAKPFPIAAVVLPNSSSESVIQELRKQASYLKYRTRTKSLTKIQ